jgi:hypothetical protein
MTGVIRGCLRSRRRVLIASALLAGAVLMPVLPSAAVGKVRPGDRGARWFSNPVLGPGQDPSVLAYGGW